ncbi:MAG TPA: alpha/beta hydrolase [Chloroflexus aurantiacus]|uniref:Alpha/beta hydrolase fold-containing protein n=1 Tax=Chloroflexus aurantiacus (strain ATCC 29366 / DSM 635 / J-10-fl) TaxID=324602 RepID=A9WFR8_CHLAA|nr:alpha/beta hydrolase [Chloroflexus aurantiacus]ABY35418.1 alpha/beta hydrolase fold-containing protein [Chloroflexus aurantiacus J-10-fl]RMG49858.1 MAG: alpha/beta hydrolase [Chloroflexota bacterium]GIV92148.1 MAG: alpha/beta hydrolase [Chloroflexus sp.]HBW65756.1 alpha/beta hydrolase [Chloroflexus aurantiacus]
MKREPTMDIPVDLVPYARRVALRDVDIFYYAAGSTNLPPLLLLHGLGDEADTWRAIISPLSQMYRVIAPDLPGFGRSSGPKGGYSLTFFARTMAEFITTLQLQQITLVGHSMGAMIAQRLSIGLPHLIQQQILISGCLPVKRRTPPRQWWPLLIPGLGELVMNSMRRSQELAFLSLQPFYYSLYDLPARERRFLRRRVWKRLHHPLQRRATLSALRWLAIDAFFRAEQYLDLVSECQTPTVLISGDHDVIVDGELIESMEVVLEGRAQYIYLSRCGHVPQQEQPDLICELISGLSPAMSAVDLELQGEPLDCI